MDLSNRLPLLLLLVCCATGVADQVPRYIRDKRCPAGLKLDPAGKRREPSSTSQYKWNPMDADATPMDCGNLCCGDWSCESFDFHPDGKDLPEGTDCPVDKPCCVFRDDIDPLVTPAPGDPVVSGLRSKLPSLRPKYPNSSVILGAYVDPKYQVAVQGDEFPITWGADGNQYTGAGDNNQGQEFSPAAFFKVKGGPMDMNCTDPSNPSPQCTNMTLQGSTIPVRGKWLLDYCENWNPWHKPEYEDVPNIKSNSVISIDGVLYWAVTCFNYGDDLDFNRQRYGPSWIITSEDGGVTWNLNATNPKMFTGRLAAPRFVQFGRDNAGARDEYVYVHFQATNGGAAFFEQNDMLFLGRVPKDQILNRTAYEFYNGEMPDGQIAWVSDDSIAVPVWSYPLMTAVQQVNYHFETKSYIFANWAWISYDGHPRPDHSPDERNDRTKHQRSQLVLVEAPEPWGPFSIFHIDDDWSGWDGSTGAYTPVFPPAWMGPDNFWMVSTQCCDPFPVSPPNNHYTFNAQHVTLKLNMSSERLLVKW
eukprot:jgi/Bigna1/126926/aug1.3_g1634